MSPTTGIVDIILKKKAGLRLSQEEIAFIVQGYADNRVPDYQMAALLMAICWRGMDQQEIADLTLSMVRSGETLDLHDVAGITVDKHSTGGVGDKTSLVLAPLVASCGLTMAKMSGRGLGFSGGTMDKLESIPGFGAELSLQQFRQAARQVGLVISAQSVELAPADRKMYALRDVTGTVESIPLIASSVMSKKIAAGSDCIVLDVKVGRGTFTPTFDQALLLANTMVDIGRRAGRQVRAIISSMDQPLGCAVGNALELDEAIRTLQGHGPKDLLELCLVLGGLLLQMAGRTTTPDQARELLEQQLASGDAWRKFRAFVANQGGDLSVLDDPEKLPRATIVHEHPSPQHGYLARLDARSIAQACFALGAGRQVKDAPIDHAVGIVLQAKVGDMVRLGQPLLSIHANDCTRLEQAREIVAMAFSFSPDPVAPPPLILGVV